MRTLVMGAVLVAALASCAGSGAERAGEERAIAPSAGRYGNSRCRSDFPVGSSGWMRDCTPPAPLQLGLSEGVGLAAIVAAWGEPDTQEVSLCQGQDAAWPCRRVVYGGCALVFHDAADGQPLNFWSCP